MASRNGQGHNPGQFRPGNPGGPGRPRRQTEREYLQALTECVGLAEWKAVVRRALEDARKGDHRAREWLGKYLMGSDPLLAELTEEAERLQREYAAKSGRDL